MVMILVITLATALPVLVMPVVPMAMLTR